MTFDSGNDILSKNTCTRKGWKNFLDKKIKIMNVGLNFASVSDLLPVVDTFFQTPELNTICAISMRMIMMAQKEGNINEVLNGYDLALPGEEEILHHGNIKEARLSQEIKENLFFKEFMKRVESGEKKVYLLGDTEYQVNELKNYILKEYPQTFVAGQGFLTGGKDVFALINEINILTPDVILSVIPSPQQEWFVRERKNMLDGKIWYGLNGNYRLNTAVRMVSARMETFVRKLSFKNLMERYHKEQEEK